MTEWPPVTVLLVTFNRPDEIRQTIKGLQKHLIYEGDLRWHLADDGSLPDYVADLKEGLPEWQFSLTKTSRKGWGANVNAAMRFIKTPYIFLCEDDCVAFRDIDLNLAVRLLEFDQELGMVRFSGLIKHELILVMKRAKTEQGQIYYLALDKKSPELWQYSHRPHLKHRRFHECYGCYDEGKTLTATEIEFAERYKGKKGPQIVALSNGVDEYCDHIGESWKRTKFDVGAK